MVTSNPESGETGSKTEDFRTKHGKQEAKQRISEQNNGFRSKTAGETGSETKDFRSKPGKPEAKQRISEVNLGNRKQHQGKQKAKQRISEQNLLFLFPDFTFDFLFLVFISHV